MIDFNWWRANYDRMDFAEHQAFNAACLEQFPVQRSFNTEACARFLEERQPKTVVELGGWDGGLATEMLERFGGIDTWLNYDITPDVPQECGDPRYDVVVLDGWPWDFKVTADALVASHVVEHMRISQVELLLNAWDVRHAYIDTPLGGNPQWEGYQGSHIIETGAAEFLQAMDDAGWTVSHSEPGLVAFLDR